MFYILFVFSVLYNIVAVIKFYVLPIIIVSCIVTKVNGLLIFIVKGSSVLHEISFRGLVVGAKRALTP